MEKGSNKLFGPPGSGKTSRLIRIISESGVPLKKIAYCTFGRHALEDMIKRMNQKGIQDSDMPYFKTLHSMNFSLLGIRKEQVANEKKLKDFCKEKGYVMSICKKDILKDDPYSLLNSFDKEDTLDDKFYKQMQKDRSDRRPFDYIHPRFQTMAGLYMRFKHNYMDWLRENDYIDFIGMIEEGIKRNVCPNVDLLCVDEWQDLNTIQIEQVQMWMTQIPTSFHAGDDDQCIYEFAGSDPYAFLNLKCDNETVLQETFRLPKDVLSLSLEVINRNKNRKVKDVHTNKDEGGIYLKTLENACKMLQMLPREESVVFLVRNNFIVNQLWSDLADQGVPIGGYAKERSAVKLMQRGYNENTFRYEEMDALLSPIFPTVRYFLHGSKSRIKKSLINMPEKGYTRDDLSRMGLTQNFFDDLLAKNCSYLNIQENKLLYINRLFEKYGYNPKPVQITTIHKFKGMEADTIVLVPDITKACADNEMAHAFNMDAVESERRNWYVAITRAAKRLIILDDTDYSNYKTKELNSIRVFLRNKKNAQT